MENLSNDTKSLTSIDEEQFVQFKQQKKMQEAAANVQKMECDCLSPYIERSALKSLCREANACALGAVVVPPLLVKQCVSFLGRDPKTSLIAAISYPDGGDVTEVKCKAVKRAVKDGVDEVEVCAPHFAIKDGAFSYFKRECKKLKKAAKHRALRVVLNAGLLNKQELSKACQIAADVGVNLIRLCGNVEGDVLDKVKLGIKDRCLLKFDNGENVAGFENALNLGAAKVACKNAVELARLILSEANK